MSRRAKVFIEGLSVHVIQRGNNGLTVFHRDADHEVFLALLRVSAVRQSVAVHAFVCMKTHFHLIDTPPSPDSLPRMMRQLDGRYVHYFNRIYQRTGTLWNGRYRRFLIQTERYWLTCLRYVEQNPVRARVVDSPDSYRWSSYSSHAFGNGPSWLTPHPVYEALGRTPENRQAAYRALCGSPVSDEESVLIEESLSTAGREPDVVAATSEPDRTQLRARSDAAATRLRP